MSLPLTRFTGFCITLVYFLRNSWYTKTSLFVCLLVYCLCPLLDSPSPTRPYCFWGQEHFSLLLSNVSSMHSAYHIICAQWSICWMNEPIQWNSFMWVSCSWVSVVRIEYCGPKNQKWNFMDGLLGVLIFLTGNSVALYLPFCGQVYSLVPMYQSTNICWTFSVCWVMP